MSATGGDLHVGDRGSWAGKVDGQPGDSPLDKLHGVGIKSLYGAPMRRVQVRTLLMEL